MTEPRVIATIADYSDLIAAMRARAQERRIAITSADVDEVAGLPRYYIAKLLSVNPVKRIGMISLGPLLGVLCAKLVLVEDLEALKTYGKRIPARNEACVHSGAITSTISRAFMRKIGRNGAKVRWERYRKQIQMNKKISAIKRKAVMVRWGR